jgi:[histone H3]-lysine36 N-dimethyltransferase SETMAR
VSFRYTWRIIRVCLGLVIRCARWVPKLLTPLQKKSRKSASKENLWLHSQDPDFFFNQIVTGDETYIHHFEPETKRQSMQWLPVGSQAPIKAIKKISSKKVMALVFWDRAGVLLIRYFRKGSTMTGLVYAKILGELKKAIQKKRGDMWDDGVFLLHDNASSHTSRVSQTAISELGFIQLTHPPYSPDLAPSDYFLFPKLKDFLRKRTFTNDLDLEKSTKQWLLHQPPSFYEKGISALQHRWEKCILIGGDYVEK